MHNSLRPSASAEPLRVDPPLPAGGMAESSAAGAAAASVATDQPVSQLPGAAFLQRRVRRAAALLPAERPPEVSAFLDSLQLLQEVQQALPCTHHGQPELPHSPVAQRRVALASMKAARACYLCPSPPPTLIEAGALLNAYVPWLREQQQQQPTGSSRKNGAASGCGSSGAGGRGPAAAGVAQAPRACLATARTCSPAFWRNLQQPLQPKWTRASLRASTLIRRR